MEQVPFLDRFKWIILVTVGAIVLAVFGYFLLAEDKPVTIVIQAPPPTATHTPTLKPTLTLTPLPTVTYTPTLKPTLTLTPAPLQVYVTGAVARPESLLILLPGARVSDAIEAAGGTTEDADLSRVNLAQRLQDGDQVHVPSKEEKSISTPTPNKPRVIDLNTATLEEFEALPGIGPTTAQAIIDYRTQNGAFRSIEDLTNVPGIGKGTLAKIHDLVMIDPDTLPTLEGTPTTPAAASPAATEAASVPVLLDLNTATQAELEALPGIGPVTAQKIIDYRTVNGAFRTVDDLMNVSGIGPATLNKIRDQITVR